MGKEISRRHPFKTCALVCMWEIEDTKPLLGRYFAEVLTTRVQSKQIPIPISPLSDFTIRVHIIH